MHFVLFIDDDALFLHAVAESLSGRHRKIGIETATTAEQGLRLLGRRQFDAIISDFRMPGLNGIDLLKECAVACPDTPVVVHNGYSSPALAHDAFNNGAYAVLQKPVDSDVIYSVVTRAILRAAMLRRALPSDLTPPEIQRRELASHRRRLSARLSEITHRLQDALETDQPS